MLRSFLLLMFLVLSPILRAQALVNDLVPFQTDFCTGFPEGTRESPMAWRDCCILHDMFFWGGGDKKDRDHSDALLRTCVEEKGYPGVAWIIYQGVRVGSYSPIKFENKKWNFAWPKRPTHQKLTPADIDLLEEEIFSKYEDIPDPIKNDFIAELRTRK